MYAGFFGLRQTPFSIAPDPHYLYLSERHREALAHLLYGVQGGGGFVLLTGEIGAGKTTVCRAFLDQMPAHCRVAYVFNPKLTVTDLLKTICHEFHIAVQPDGPGPATLKDYLDPLNAHLLACHAQGLQNLLIIDEAQSLSPHVLEQLRLLTNLETAERKLLQIILIGQPELRQMLAQPELEQVAQRVIARYHLGALDAAETRQYIQHRLAVAGLQGPLPFSDAALGRIHAITRGVPRRINLLCDRALLGAYASERREVDVSIVNRAAQEVFDAPPSAIDPATRGRRKLAWTSLGWGALGGAVVLALAALALWWRPAWFGPAAPSAPRAEAAEPPAAEAAPASPATTPLLARATTADAGASEPDAVEPPPPPLIRTLPPRDQLLAGEDMAWRELAPLWGQELDRNPPCDDAQAQGLQCFRTWRMTAHGLRQLDRPAILTLSLDGGTSRVLVTRLDGDMVTLQAGQRRWRMDLNDLSPLWQGQYATLWRTPPGTTSRLGGVSSGPAAEWMDERLRILQARGQLPAAAPDFAARLEAFQRSQGIEGGGKATPMTFMQVNRLSGVEEPRLTRP